MQKSNFNQWNQRQNSIEIETEIELINYLLQNSSCSLPIFNTIIVFYYFLFSCEIPETLLIRTILFISMICTVSFFQHRIIYKERSRNFFFVLKEFPQGIRQVDTFNIELWKQLIYLLLPLFLVFCYKYFTAFMDLICICTWKSHVRKLLAACSVGSSSVSSYFCLKALLNGLMQCVWLKSGMIIAKFSALILDANCHKIKGSIFILTMKTDYEEPGCSNKTLLGKANLYEPS